MSETENAVVEEVAEEGAPPKRSFKKLIIIAVVLLLAGGGGFYYWKSSAAVPEDEETAEAEEKPAKETPKKAKPKKKPVEEEEEEEETTKKPSSLKSQLPKDEDVKTIIELPPFIVNLADTDNARYLRMTVSLGVGGEEEGGGEEKPDNLFMTRVRNAMLAVLAEKKSEDILTIEGKTKLRKELLKAAKAASEEPAVEAIYITDFIIQL